MSTFKIYYYYGLTFDSFYYYNNKVFIYVILCKLRISSIIRTNNNIYKYLYKIPFNTNYFTNVLVFFFKFKV